MPSQSGTDVSSFDMQHLIESVWQAALRQLNLGSSEVVLSSDAGKILGHHGVNAIADRFSAFINNNASVLHDPSANVIRILPPPTTALRAALQEGYSKELPDLVHPARKSDNGKSKLAKDRLSKIPRPPNKFILYRQHHHPMLKALNPTMKNNDISVILGRQWKGENDAVKSLWQQKAQEVKEEHARIYPEYSYEPRKPSDKKHRRTKKEIARLAAALHGSTAQQIVLDDTSSSISSPATNDENLADDNPDFNDVYNWQEYATPASSDYIFVRPEDLIVQMVQPFNVAFNTASSVNNVNPAAPFNTGKHAFAPTPIHIANNAVASVDVEKRTFTSAATMAQAALASSLDFFNHELPAIASIESTENTLAAQSADEALMNWDELETLAAYNAGGFPRDSRTYNTGLDATLMAEARFQELSSLEDRRMDYLDDMYKIGGTHNLVDRSFSPEHGAFNASEYYSSANIFEDSSYSFLNHHDDSDTSFEPYNHITSSP